jgi:carbamate kinase
VTDAEHDSIPQQYETVCRTVPHLVELLERGWRLVVSHGNGPQVGYILRRSELSEKEVDPVPVDYAVADTQGAIGYMFVKALDNELRRRGFRLPVVAVVTQTLVDLDDPAFRHPSKPIGSFLTEANARAMAESRGWTIHEDAGRGWRRTVASPRPRRIVETELIRSLLASGAVVVAAGGGGIPVALQPDGKLVGVEAVVDKDLASGLLARELGADMLLIPTAVPRVAIRFGKPDQRWLDTITVDEARDYLQADEFGAGSMAPKVAAVADFVASTPGAVGIIGAAEEMRAIIDGKSGTRVITADATPILVAVNGTLMRGLALNPNMIEAGATFVREAMTAPEYRIWSINDEYPAMVRVSDGTGARLALEIWSVPRGGVGKIFMKEPPGLTLGKVRLDDGSSAYVLLSEPALVMGQREITQHGGWRAYLAATRPKT